MENKRRFKRVLGLRGFNFVQPNPFTIEFLKMREYEDNSNARKILDELLLKLKLEESIYIYSADQSLKVWFYSDKRLAEIEHKSLINYVEKNLIEESKNS